jgi:PAS domain S-box-containing protein
VVLFIASLFVTGALTAVATTVWFDRAPPAGSWIAACALVALLAAGEYLMIRLRYREETVGVNLFEAVLAPVLFGFPGAAAMVIAAAAQTIAALMRRNTLVKGSFNVAQWATAAGVGSIVFHALSSGNALTARNVLALLVAFVAVSVVNNTAFTVVLKLAQRQPAMKVLATIGPALLMSWALNFPFGLLFVAAYLWTPWSALLFVVPLLTLYWAYRGHASAIADRARLNGLHRATRALAATVDPRDAIPGFLQEVRTSFVCDAVDLVLLNHETRTVHRIYGESHRVYDESWDKQTLAAALAARGSTTRVLTTSPDPVTTVLLEFEGWRDCLATPLTDGERTLGVLCVYDREGLEGFEEGEEAVLEALAGEAARAMIKASLLDTVFEERQKLSDIVDRTSDGIFTLGPGGTIKTWNAALERITGHRSISVIGSRMFARLEPRDTEGVAVRLERWAENEDPPLPSDIEIKTSAGETRWLSCSYTRVCDVEGRPSILIVVARDATEARELERLKDDFVATVSHELRTPLTPIKGWAVTLLQLGDHLSHEQREEGVQAILRHAERLERLITNILEVSKVERGLADRRTAIVDVSAVVEKTVGDFQTENEHREVVLHVDGNNHRTRGDEVWVEQILSNLLSNAMKYSPADQPVEVNVSEANGSIEVSVTDRGPGIPEFEVERIFERFKRLGDHMTRSQGGTGLGLYIARQLARAIGGELSVCSAAGQGATFTLRLIAQEETIHVAS